MQRPRDSDAHAGSVQCDRTLRRINPSNQFVIINTLEDKSYAIVSFHS